MKTKVCGDCGKDKPITEYYKRPNYTNTSKIYYKTQCKVCDLIRIRKWQKENPENVREATRRYLAKLKK